MAENRIPNYRKIQDCARLWLNPETGIQSPPPTGNVHRLLGIPKGAHVLFFAGSFGEWAHALAQYTRLDYADLTAGMIRTAKLKFKGKGIRNFFEVDAVAWPEKENYDYIVSFQPFPLPERIPLILLRSMAYAKGARIIESPFEDAGWLAERYGANADIRTIQYTPNRPPHASLLTHDVLVVDSTPTSRRRALLDLGIIGLLQEARHTSRTQLVGQLEKKGIIATKDAVGKSLTRVDELSGHVDSLEALRHLQPLSTKVTVF
ncbi:class I SAM-dependent methyltransferase [Candidatus Micrarchaeota archaeon]|nr:class I SAM-dependent methyltransferase [Candidatus Micrarchaeota archaeon]